MEQISPPTANKISALILAGGAGRRVRGRDKGLIEWRGQPLIAWVYQRIAPQAADTWISCNRNRARYARFAALTPGDRRTDYQGPLAGLEAAGPSLTGDFILLAPCDTPLLPADLGARLALALGNNATAQAAYASTGDGEHYLCALLRRSSLATLTPYLDSGQRAVRHWYREQGAVAVGFDDQRENFLNLNQLS